jgi:hypothetical protein
VCFILTESLSGLYYPIELDSGTENDFFKGDFQINYDNSSPNNTEIKLDSLSVKFERVSKFDNHENIYIIDEQTKNPVLHSTETHETVKN